MHCFVLYLEPLLDQYLNTAATPHRYAVSVAAHVAPVSCLPSFVMLCVMCSAVSCALSVQVLLCYTYTQGARLQYIVCYAGAALVTAHGKSQFQPMLQLFEGYLDKKDVGDEARYDKVREGAIVFLGTLARHLDPSDSKVKLLWPAPQISNVLSYRMLACTYSGLLSCCLRFRQGQLLPARQSQLPVAH